MSTESQGRGDTAVPSEDGAADGDADGDARNGADARREDESLGKAARGRRWATPGRAQWEVFKRDEADGRLRYAGRVRAEDAAAAHDVASRLFAWYAPEVWVCPAAAVARFSTDVEPREDVAGDEPRTTEF